MRPRQCRYELQTDRIKTPQYAIGASDKYIWLSYRYALGTVRAQFYPFVQEAPIVELAQETWLGDGVCGISCRSCEELGKNVENTAIEAGLTIKYNLSVNIRYNFASLKQITIFCWRVFFSSRLHFKKDIKFFFCYCLLPEKNNTKVISKQHFS